jgi:hypothetical protein
MLLSFSTTSDHIFPHDSHLFRRHSYESSMSNNDDESRDNSPSRPGKSTSRPSAPKPRRGPANVIEFIDSQDPNVKSAIQRHSAYHSAAQRREARIQSLRRGSQSRYMEWGRRQGADSAPAISPASSSSQLIYKSTFTGLATDSFAGSPQTNSGTLFPPSELPSLSRESSRESTIPALTPSEEAVIQECKF